MFEFLFKYPSITFSKGSFVLLGSWPASILLLCVAAAALGLGWAIWRRRQRLAVSVRGMRSLALWGLQTALVALLLLLLWQPALSITTLKPQQNIVAVIIDDSSSMNQADADGHTRLEQARGVLNSDLLNQLQKRFQVRIYSLGERLQRVQKADQLRAAEPATHIGSALTDVVAEAGTLPIGAVVLLSDGADNSGGIDRETISAIRRQRIPIHTIGFGREHLAHDLEIEDVQVPAKALAGSRLQAEIAFRGEGYTGSRVRVAVRENGKLLGSSEVPVRKEGAVQTEALLFNAGEKGVKNLDFSVDPLPGEENPNNNRLTRVLNVRSERPRILYVEGEPRWDFKFIRRAVEDDHNIDLVTMLRTTQNKIYRQNIANPSELEAGFPSKVEDLFGYSAIILGSVEAGYFNTAQQDLLQQFVDRRGGGLLFLGGRFALADGGYSKAPFADLLPVKLPDHSPTFHRDPAYPELAPAGRDSLICRIEEDPQRNVARWSKLPWLMNYQDAGTPKPGAVVLAQMQADGRKLPLLITETYGRGRTAVFATGGDWRWQMQQPVEDMSHETFWRQLMRWLVTDTPTRVVASTPRPVLSDEGNVVLRAEVRDTTYLPSSDAQVSAHIVGPSGAAQTVDLHPDSSQVGLYTAELDADRPGSYAVEITALRGHDELGRDSITFRRENGIAENFHREQNRDLLEKLSSETGGRYYHPEQASRLAEEISYSEAGISIRETKDLWDMPIVFLAALMLRGSEWLLRRKWGVV